MPAVSRSSNKEDDYLKKKIYAPPELDVTRFEFSSVMYGTVNDSFHEDSGIIIDDGDDGDD